MSDFFRVSAFIIMALCIILLTARIEKLREEVDQLKETIRIEQAVKLE